MADGSVEIAITGRIDPSVAASANEAKSALSGVASSTTVSASAMAAALAATGGNLKKITPDMVGLGTAAKATAVAQETLAGATAGAAAAQAAETVVTRANVGAINSSRAAYESLALVHEALSGRFTRMVGTSTILAQALAGQAATTAAVSFVTSGLGLAILGTVAAVGLLTAATISAENEEKKLTETALGLGAQSGITAQQMKEIGESADFTSQSVRETTKASEAFAAAGVRNIDVNRQLSNSIEAYSELIGVKFAQAQKKLAEAMKDPVKGAKELHDQLGILDGDQLEQIQTLTALGQKDEAVAIITQALKQRIDEAKEAGVGLRGEFGQLIDVLSNVYNWIGEVDTALDREAGTILGKLIPALHAAGVAHREAAAAAQQQAQNEAQLNEISGKGKAAFDETPEGKALKERSELQGKLSAARDALKVDTALHGANSEAVKRDREAVADFTHAVQTYLTPIQQKIKADQLDVEITKARKAHHADLVAKLTEEKALIQESGKVESDADAKALASVKGDVAGARAAPSSRKAKGPDIVSDWTEQLHAMEVASNDFFGDETQKELEFWQSKIGLVKKGSKDWLDVQSKIYDAEKTLAHRAYEQHLADLNDRIEADHGNFKKQQADWAEKLAFIKSKFGEESTEYKDAHREIEAEERRHQDQLLRDELTGQSKAVTALKTHLQALSQLRQEDAKEAEALIKEQSNNALLGEVTAANRIRELHRQLSEQEIADATAAFNAEDALRQKGLADALATWGAEDDRYKAALQDEKDATQKFYDQIALMQAKSAAQQIADIIAVKNAYSGYISGTVNAMISGLDGMASKTENWKKALIGVYVSLVQSFESALDKMLTNWIVTHVFMTKAERQQLELQKAQHAAAETVKTTATTTATTTRTTVATIGTTRTSALETTSVGVHTAAEHAKTGATTTGVATRSSVENSGFFAKLLGLLGISVGAHTSAEASKTAATTTGATSRAAAEQTAQTTALAEQEANNALLIVSYAAVAGAAGTASFAAAPWPVDTGAPAFGAAMYQDALAYATLAQLDTGTNYLPRDMVVQAHEGERVIPKADNRQLMQILALGASGSSDARPDVHLYYGPHIHERERIDLKQLLASGGGDLLTFINQAVRDGKLRLQPR